MDRNALIGWRLVSLTARLEAIEDAALVILLGQGAFRSNDGANGSEMMGESRQERVE